MINWLLGVLGTVPADSQFIVVIGATVIVILFVVSILNALFIPFRFK